MTVELHSATKRAIRVNAADNVATLMDDVAGGWVTIYGPEAPLEIQALEPIAHGHKIALDALPADAPIVKFGVPIGLSTAPILRGQWVHLHNCRSQVDERSSHLDLKTGAAKDTPYA
jgi:altronate dehydratase small subunit